MNQYQYVHWRDHRFLLISREKASLRTNERQRDEALKEGRWSRRPTPLPPTPHLALHVFRKIIFFPLSSLFSGPIPLSLRVCCNSSCPRVFEKAIQALF